MAANAAEILERFFDEVGADVGELARDEEVIAWFNAGVARLPARYPRTASITWAGNASSITLPTDFSAFDRVEVTTGILYSHVIWGSELRFFTPTSSSGAGTLFYYAHFPPVDGSNDSVLSPIGDEACLSYALFRFFRKLAASRADFRRYATITGQTGLDVSDLDAVAERYRQDYIDARQELEDGDFAQPVGLDGV